MDHVVNHSVEVAFMTRVDLSERLQPLFDPTLDALKVVAGCGGFQLIRASLLLLWETQSGHQLDYFLLAFSNQGSLLKSALYTIT